MTVQLCAPHVKAPKRRRCWLHRDHATIHRPCKFWTKSLFWIVVHSVNFSTSIHTYTDNTYIHTYRYTVYIHLHTYIYTYSVHTYAYILTPTYMQIYRYIHGHISTLNFFTQYVYLYVTIYRCIHSYIHDREARLYVCIFTLNCMWLCMNVCMYVSVTYVCMYVCECEEWTYCSPLLDYPRATAAACCPGVKPQTCNKYPDNVELKSCNLSFA